MSTFLRSVSNNIGKHISKQAVLFIYVLIVLLLPNIVLLRTDYFEPCEIPAFLLLPLAVYMLLLLIGRRPGIGVLVLSLLLFLCGVQLVLLYLFGGSIISVDMFINATASNASETGELFGTLWPMVLGASIIYLSPLFFAIKSITKWKPISNRFVYTSIALAGLCLGGGIISVVRSKQSVENYSVISNIYPLNVVNNICIAVDKIERNVNYPKEVADFTFHAQKTETAQNEREIYILVIGETSRAANWSLYGYNRDTNPLLEKEENLLVFKDVLTQANITHRIVPLILSAAGAENFSTIYEQKSIVTAFKEVGFKTWFISNQTPNRSFIDYFAAEADSTINLQTGDVKSIPYDMALLDKLKNAIAESKDNLFIVLHTYGSHFEYNMRYPREMAHFKPDMPKRLSVQYRDEYVNAYDNAIRYTDYFLSTIINTLRETPGCTAMLYLSDHGEDLMDDSRNMFLHCSPVPTYYQLHVPFILWMSDSYRANFPKQVKNVTEHTDTPFSSNAVFHSLLDMAHIYTFNFEPKKSIFNSQYTIAPRYFITDHDEPIELHELVLRKEDLLLMKERGIDF